MKSPLTFALLLQAASLFCQNWQPISDFSSHERDDAVVFTIGSKAYCGSGLSSWFAPLGDFKVLDMNSGNWSNIASLPKGMERQYASAFSAKGMGYVFGGVNSSGYLNDLWQYNPGSDSWLQKVNLPDSGISGSIGFVIGDTAYIVCGRTSSENASDKVWAYDINNDAWFAKSDFPFGGRWRASGASINGKGYLIFGADSTHQLHSELYEYNPQLDSWTFTSSFPGFGRNYAALQYLKGQLLVFGGVDSSGTYHNDLWRFNPIVSLWYLQKAMPAGGRKGGLCFSDGQSLYYSTGIDSINQRLKETWKCNDPLISILEKPLLDFEIYPIPAHDMLIIKPSNQGSFDEILIGVYDLNGKLLLQRYFDKNEIMIPLTALPKGSYFLEIHINQGSFRKKIIKL